MPLKKDDLRFTRIAVQAGIFSPPDVATQGIAGLAPRALSPKDASAIFGEVARFGFSSLQQVPGGVQLATGDGISVMTLTGTGWAFAEDLARSEFRLATDKMETSVRALLDRLPTGTFMVNPTIDLQAVWENLGQPADEHIERRFLTPQAKQIVDGIPGLEFAGSGIRLSLRRHPLGVLPVGVQAQSDVWESFDVRVEPLFAEKSKLFLEATAFLAPTADLAGVTEGAQFVRDLLWEHVAANIALEA